MDDPPPRPSSAAVAAALARVAGGEPCLADAPGSEIRCNLQRVDLLSRWQLAIWWRDGALGPLHSAVDPEGLQWVYGCARWPDWLAGPESVILDPIAHLLTDSQRQQLHAVLLDVPCWPATPQAPQPEPPTLAEIFPPDDLTLIPS